MSMPAAAAFGREVLRLALAERRQVVHVEKSHPPESDRHWVSYPPVSQMDEATLLPSLVFMRMHCLPPCSLISETHPGRVRQSGTSGVTTSPVSS